MTDKKYDPKFEPLAGHSYNISLRFDEPLQKEGQYGVYWMTSINVDDKGSHTWFLDEWTHRMVVGSQLKKGETARLNVSQMKNDKGKLVNTFELITGKGVTYSHDKMVASPSSGAPDPYTEAPPPGFETDSPTPKSLSPNNDLVFQQMEKCWIAAYEMSEKLLAMGAQKDPLENPTAYKATSEDVRSVAISMFIQLNR